MEPSFYGTIFYWGWNSRAQLVHIYKLCFVFISCYESSPFEIYSQKKRIFLCAITYEIWTRCIKLKVIYPNDISELGSSSKSSSWSRCINIMERCTNMSGRSAPRAQTNYHRRFKLVICICLNMFVLELLRLVLVLE